ncbi:MAG: complex I NDUFA9 subunit family protein [Hyphomonadaceae bacterium]
MQGDLIVVFGGSGFIGKQVVRTLAKRGKRVRVPMRRPHLGAELRVLGDVGQIQLVQANVRYPESIARALEGATGAVNCIGLLSESGPQTFSAVQAEGAAAIAREAAAKGITRLVQVSAIGADARSPSRYARTKADAEEAVRQAVPSAAIVRPSIVFGPEDTFFNRFADMAKFAPALPLIGGGKTKFQPIYVQDAAEAIANALDLESARGRVFEIGGPRVYTFKELLQFTLRESARRRPLIPLPFFMAQPMGMLLDWTFKLIPFFDAPLTGDQVLMLKRDSVVAAQGVGTIADLGVSELESVEAIVPGYLWRFRPHGQFEAREAKAA